MELSFGLDPTSYTLRQHCVVLRLASCGTRHDQPMERHHIMCGLSATLKLSLCKQVAGLNERNSIRPAAEGQTSSQ